MFRFGKWLAIGFAVCMLAAPKAKAGVGFQPVSPDELKMTSEPLAPGAPAIILYRQVDQDDNIHTPHEDHYVRIKILTEEGRKYADVEIPFSKENEDIVHVQARTIRPDGSIADFGGKVFDKNLVKGKIEGRQIKYLAKTFTLSDVQVGSIIEYSYTRDFHEGGFSDSVWILSDELFTKKAQFSLRPADNPYLPSLRWSWNTLPPGTTPPKQAPDHLVRMEANNIPAFQTEEYMPPPDELKSRVDFIYEGGVVEKDQTRYWKEVGKKWNGWLEDYVGKRKAMERAVAQIVSPNDSQEVKLRKIYDRVQQIRNTSYEMQKTAQEQKRGKEKWEDNVEDVWKRGYGTSIQLTWLFVGLARAAGFETYGCWVSDRGRHLFDPVTRQSAKLGSNVALVKLNGTDLYFDPGIPFTPFRLLTWSETGVMGLRLDKDGGDWIWTPEPEASESKIARVGKLNLSEAGDLEGKITVTYTGLEAMSARLEEIHADDVDRKRFLEESLTDQIPVAAEAVLTNKPDWTSSETPLVAEFDLKIPGWAASAGRRTMVPAAIFTAVENGLFQHTHRVHPISFAHPYVKEEDVTIELAPGWQVNSVPKPREQNTKAIAFNLKVEQGTGTFRLMRNLTVNVTLIEQKYYGALRNFFQGVRTADGEQIVLQPGEIHASN